MRKAFQSKDWTAIRNAWISGSQIIVGHTGHLPRLRRSSAYLLGLAAKPDADAFFGSHLDDPDPRIVAYCLIGLELLGSHRLGELPELIARRDDELEVISGHSVLGISLSDFADSITERYRQGRSLERWLSFGYRVEPDALGDHLQQLALQWKP